MITRIAGWIRANPMAGIGAGALFLVVYIAASSSLYFGLGMITEQGLGMTPLVLLIAGVFFVCTFMSYVEGSSLHIERGGASSFARFAFDELVSFVAGWAILLDYIIVLALVASTVPNYLSPFWGEFETHTAEMIIPAALIIAMAVANVRGVSAGSLRKRLPLGFLDLLVLLAVIAIGAVTLWQPSLLTDSIELGTTPTWKGLALAMILATIAGTGIEAASGLAGEIRIGRKALRSVVLSSAASTITIFAGISFVALMAEPVVALQGGGAASPLGGEFLEKPVLGVVATIEPSWLADALAYVVGAMAVITLIQAARIYTLGPMRMTYALATNRQVPSVIGRLHPRFGTPYVAATIVAVAASGLALLDDPELLTAIFAFGALLTFSIANLSIIKLRFSEPDAARAYRVPWSVKIGRGTLPLPSVVALFGSSAAFIGVLTFRGTATLVGLIWMTLGLTLYVTYRKTQGKPLRQRVTIPEGDLRRRSREEERAGYGSILVPVFGGVLDDDIVGTAGRLAMEEADDEEGGAMIEALHVIEVPMSQPIDAPVTEERLKRARQILARAKEVGEEYAGVEVATATVRARSTGEAIVREAARRGVEVIVLAAERPSRIRGGPLLGGVEPRAAEFVGKVTEYVTRKAPCQVILTAPPETDVDALLTSIKDNPHVSDEFADKEAERLERLAGATGEHDPVAPGLAPDSGAVRPHEHEADHDAVADDEDPDDFIDTIV